MSSCSTFPQRLPVLLLVILTCFSFHHKALALNLDIRSSPNNTLDFSLVLSSQKIDLINAKDNTQVNAQNRLRRVGVITIDVPREGIRPELQLGYAFLRQDNIMATSGMPLNGYYAGLGFQLPLFSSSRVESQFTARYIWQTVTGSTAQQSTTLEWNEFDVGFSATLKFVRFHIKAGIYFSSVDATQTASGNITETLLLETGDSKKSQLGLDYKITEDESISFNMFHGSAQGVELGFRKLFP